MKAIFDVSETNLPTTMWDNFNIEFHLSFTPILGMLIYFPDWRKEFNLKEEDILLIENKDDNNLFGVIDRIYIRPDYLDIRLKAIKDDNG